jgi:hypothetical protein
MVLELRSVEATLTRVLADISGSIRMSIDAIHVQADIQDLGIPDTAAKLYVPLSLVPIGF